MSATKILIIGGGAAGITVAASLTRHSDGKNLDITVIDPASKHYYQPAFTLVGAGCYDFDNTYKPMASVIPAGVQLISKAVEHIDPDQNQIRLAGGDALSYDYLVVCPGLILDWDAIEGLKESLGKNGVCTNYSPDYVKYTWECMQNLKAGDTAIFSQAPLPFKCPGAPQKVAYLTADLLKKKGILSQCDLHFVNPGPGMFGVPFFAKQLSKVADRYGIHKDLLHKLIKVDGEAQKATVEVVGGDQQGEIKEMDFNMIHVTPHQKPPVFLQESTISNDAGYVDIDQESMQHVTYPNIFSLGDAGSTPNSKTAAAVRKQAPTVVQNIKNMIDGIAVEKSYYGYASCPLTTARDKVILAEFIYGGKVTPTMPSITKPYRESKAMWYCKTTGLPLLYWNWMLKGKEAFFEPDLNYDTGEG